MHGDISVMDFKKLYDAASKELDVHTKYVNDGASGGQKKRNEMLQLKVLQPKYALLDETDSGLDVDALKVVANTVKQAVNNGCGVLLVTHYLKFLEYLQPDDVTVIGECGKVEQAVLSLHTKLKRRGTVAISKSDCVEVFQNYVDPELGIDVWTLGLIYEYEVKGDNVDVKMTFTTPLCPFGPQMVEELEMELNKKVPRRSRSR